MYVLLACFLLVSFKNFLLCEFHFVSSHHFQDQNLSNVCLNDYCTQESLTGSTRQMFLLTKTKRLKKVHCNIISSRKRFLKIKTCSAEGRSES